MFTRGAVLLALAIVAAAQDISIRPRFVVGDEFRLEITRSREDSARPKTNYTSRYPVTVRVVSPTAKAAILDWRPGNAELVGEGIAADPTLAAVGGAIGNVQFRLALDADGAFERVTNDAELRPKLETARDLIVKSLRSELPADQRAKAEALLRQVLSPDNLIGFATREAQYYLAMNGLSQAVGDTLEVKVQQPSPFGGSPLPAVFRARIEEATAENAVVRTTTTFDADALLKMAASVMAQTDKPPAPEELAAVRLESGEEGRYLFDRRLGLMREVTITKTVRAGPGKRLDRWVIRLVSEPRR